MEEKTLRQKYMSKEITHREFYAAVLKDAGVRLDRSHYLVKMCENLDPKNHYNEVGLATWDRYPAPLGLVSAFKRAGDYMTPAGKVCALKEAVQQALES
jgi:hypothetical protein